MSQISSKSVLRFERRSRKCVKRRSLIKIVNIGDSDLISYSKKSKNQKVHADNDDDDDKQTQGDR